MAIITPNASFSQEPTSKVLAMVGQKPITQDDVNRFIAAMGANGQAYNNPQGHAVVLEQLIAQKLFLLEAQRNLFEREPAFKEQLNAVKEQLLTEYAISKCISSVTATEEETRAYYDAHKDELSSGETVNASHILVDTKEKAESVLEELRAGTLSFEDAARKYSSCPSSKDGGNLGDFGSGQMVPEFDTAVFAMEVGEISEPVKTQFGWHIIKLNAKNPAATYSYAEIRKELTQQIIQEKKQAAYQKKINQLKILFPVDKY